jgi:Putative restriction endonuclease
LVAGGPTVHYCYPDLFVYPYPVDPLRGSVSILVDGPPLLVIEVLSESTFEADTDPRSGKAYSYAAAGVKEYLTLDPAGVCLPNGGLGWRLRDGQYDLPWELEADRRWHSQEIPVAFALDGVQVAVYTREGRRLLREGEVEVALHRWQEQAREREEIIARQAAEIERLRSRQRRAR